MSFPTKPFADLNEEIAAPIAGKYHQTRA